MSAEILRRAADAMRNDALSMEANSMPADAAWHPDVALAVADWLMHEACASDEYTKQGYHFPEARLKKSSAVARAYLGES